MSNQIKNKLILNQKEFDILKATQEGLIEPKDFGIKSKYRASILMRGYLTSYKIDSNSNFILNNFRVNVNMNDDMKIINGVSPHISSKTDLESRTTYREYRNLNLFVNYSGDILIGKGVISNLNIRYRLYGTEYEEVFELNIEKGKVVSIKNLSEKIKLHKLKFKNGDWDIDTQGTEFDNEIVKWLFRDIQF
ncbi:hypothetical protein [Winogradskyella sp. SYSU M77433]|uniref:hypothetical protein n=1 Tax=Winogradskyella sp. SYSU M77433 TaxID=3042722 RepID=UPI0024802851|nr:hypothetical protein [Winogradskyella sp. SYSU M77433]MDH7913218.1 hypothetical protein [Winogradskyella sp. SYSU M77433]